MRTCWYQPARSVSGTCPSPSASSPSTVCCRAPSARCWGRPSCSPSARRSTASTRSYHRIHTLHVAAAAFAALYQTINLDSRWWFCWPSVKLVLQLSLCFSEDRPDVIIRVHVWMSFVIHSHTVLHTQKHTQSKTCQNLEQHPHLLLVLASRTLSSESSLTHSFIII